MAFDYSLRHQRFKEINLSSFVPMLGYESGDSYPPAVKSVDSEIADAWAQLLGVSGHPVVVSRLSHLLLERDQRTRGELARMSASAYVEVARKWDDYEGRSALIYGLAMSRFSGDADLTAAVADKVREMAWKDLAAQEGSFGSAYLLVDALLSLNDPPDDIDEMLRALGDLAIDAWTVEDVIQLQRQRAKGDQARLRELGRARIRAWMTQAEAADGFVKAMHYETAARIAGDLGEKDLLIEAQRALQSIDKSELELQRISSEVQIPQEAIEAFLSQFTDFDDWRHAINYISVVVPPTGSVQENRLALERAKIDAPLSHLMPHVMIGSDGLPRFRPHSDEAQVDQELASQERFRLQIMGPLLAESLRRILEKFANVTEEEFKTYFESLPHVTPEMARKLTLALLRFRSGDVEGAAYMATPIAEALARNLVLVSGQPLYRVQRKQSPGQYPGLGFLLGELRKIGLDESWYRFLWTFLASPAGVNFRNELFHGFLDRVNANHAALVLIAAMFLAHLGVGTSDEREIEGGASASQDRDSGSQ
ncbi:MAG: DUF4209 domain-containing protein [Actinomycetota bacterium]|nr:DUF4209 domain-containing protein [Actinomycetota bacterium]